MDTPDRSKNTTDDYDLDKGRLEKKTTVVHHNAIEPVEEKGHWSILHTYSNGGEDVEWVVDVPAVEGKPAWDETVITYDYIPYTEEELLELDEQHQRQSMTTEVQAALITAQINTLNVDDSTALRWRVLYPKWEANMPYSVGIKVQYNHHLYRCLQGHTSQIGWEPENVPAIWTEINESHSGSIDDPIPYNNNMALDYGKYYIQDGVKYHCIRETGIPVYNPLSDLVGLYVEVAI